MSGNKRYPLVDTARGTAIVLMLVYHFCYDLTYFQFTSWDFYTNQFWIEFRSLIVSLFLLVVGISLVLATRNRIHWSHFFKRLGILSFFALLITAISYFMFPGRTILIGILHFIAVASVLALPFRNLYRLNLVLGAGVILAGMYIKSPYFNDPWLHWLGFMTHKPPTEDYVPVFPWFGLVLIGMFLGKSLLRYPQFQKVAARPARNRLYHLVNLAGRHSLTIYLVHQPILMGILYSFRQIIR